MTALVSPDWLESRLGDPGIAIIDVSSLAPGSDESGRIPGAHRFFWKDLLWDPLERDFPTPGEMAARLGALGITNDTTIVALGEPVQYGTYLRWVLRYTGHDDVRVLDGARTRWALDARPLTRDAPVPRPVTYDPRPRREAMRAFRDDVRAAIGTGTLLLDHRSAEEYAGSRVNMPGNPDVGAERAGRIPGARHLPFTDLLETDTRFRPVDALRAVFARAAPDPGQPIIGYCRLSHRATLANFVLTELLGYANARVYDGSWTEWGSLVAAPIER